MNRKPNKLARIFTISLIVVVLFLLCSGLTFTWKHAVCLFSEDHIADHQLLGTFGDFVGGILGTILSLFSIFLVVKTFTLQQEITQDNKGLTEVQHFNSLLFELLSLYKNEIDGLVVLIKEDPNNPQKLYGRDFFDYQKKQIQQAFCIKKSFEKNQTEALKTYMIFYGSYKERVGSCYRTLYRIYDLIDKSSVDESVKKDYLKIIRAQLSESELFFLRYNAMCFYGSGFQDYINKYNVLKHLPIFELLEFKDWWAELTDEERVGINILFYYVAKKIYHKLCRENKEEPSTLAFSLPRQSKYNIGVFLENRSALTIVCFVNHNQENASKEYKGLDKFNSKQIQALFDCFLKEVFIYSNFKKINNTNNLHFFSDSVETKNNVDRITSGVKTKNTQPLQPKYDHHKNN